MAENDARQTGTVMIRRLVLAVVAALIVTAALQAAVLALVNRPAWWQGFLPATIVSVLAATLSLVPLAVGLRRGLYWTAGGFFVAAGLRAIASLGGCMLAIVAGGTPRAPTLLLMVPYYFAVLAVESAIVSRAMWNQKA